MGVEIQSFYDKGASTLTYVVWDPISREAAIIDSVLNYQANIARTSTTAADEVIAFVRDQKLSLKWLLETHIHADHLSAAYYIRDKLGGKICIGSRIKEVLAYWVPMFNAHDDTPVDGSQFDRLLEHQEILKLGELSITIFQTPGHTQACVCYLIEDAIFVGDIILMPDSGTARTDFPGGSAEAQYDSLQQIFSLPDETRIFSCHDYPPDDRPVSGMSTVGEQKQKNILINEKTTRAEYIEVRTKRDIGRDPPILLLPSIQFNMRAGSFGTAEDNGVQYVKLPVNRI